VVLVDLGEGRFEPRPVKLGARGDEYVAILDGVKEGETVVVAANFLLDAESNLKAALGAFTGDAAAAKGKATTSHQAHGTLVDIDAKSGALTIAHEPVPSLKWPKMTMEFMPANEAIAKAVKPGVPITFEFVERKPGEWVVTKITPATQRSSAAAKK
jgi:Cu/Ag efflux protein CusF